MNLHKKGEPDPPVWIQNWDKGWFAFEFDVWYDGRYLGNILRMERWTEEDKEMFYNR